MRLNFRSWTPWWSVAGGLLAVLLIAVPARAVPGPVVVFDAETGRVLIEERAAEPWYPASLTKLMTAYLVFEAIEEGRLSLDDKVLVSEAAAALPASKIGIPAGLHIQVEIALKSLLVHSANDMAVVLAEAVSGSLPAFIERMNATASRLGLAGTHFANPHGLPNAAQVTTARDMGLLAAAIVKEFPQAERYFSAPNIEVGGVTLRNRNGLLRQMEAADGIKTGFICASGFNLVASATLDGRRLIAVVLGGKSAPARNDLAQILLEAAAVRAAAAPHAGGPTLAQIAAPATRSQAPQDVTDAVCHGVGRITIDAATDPVGWGVSFGRFDDALRAEAVLDGRLLTTRGAFAGGRGGVVRMPSGGDYAAVVWSMAERDALTLCHDLQRHEATCDALPPETFRVMARQATIEAGAQTQSADPEDVAGSQ